MRRQPSRIIAIRSVALLTFGVLHAYVLEASMSFAYMPYCLRLFSSFIQHLSSHIPDSLSSLIPYLCPLSLIVCHPYSLFPIRSAQ